VFIIRLEGQQLGIPRRERPLGGSHQNGEVVEWFVDQDGAQFPGF
jgi:hypothetical protein